MFSERKFQYFKAEGSNLRAREPDHDWSAFMVPETPNRLQARWKAVRPIYHVSTGSSRNMQNLVLVWTSREFRQKKVNIGISSSDDNRMCSKLLGKTVFRFFLLPFIGQTVNNIFDLYAQRVLRNVQREHLALCLSLNKSHLLCKLLFEQHTASQVVPRVLLWVAVSGALEQLKSSPNCLRFKGRVWIMNVPSEYWASLQASVNRSQNNCS